MVAELASEMAAQGERGHSLNRMNAGPEAVERAVEILRSGGLVALPTETVYGLGADATSSEAVAKIFALKGRPSFNPLIAHVADIVAAERIGVFDKYALTLARSFWPGPMTIVVPIRPDCPVCELARAGLDTIGLRVPANATTLAILEQLDRPVAAPSANSSGRLSPTTADHVAADLGSGVDLIIDGGASRIGVESTIIACLGGTPVVLRPGGTQREELEVILDTELADPADDKVIAPGMLTSHYAPHARLRLNATDVKPGEAVLDFGGQLSGGVVHIDLSPDGFLEEAAANLFASLHQLDAAAVDQVAVAPIPNDGLGEAINDRLRRAAAPR